jgi:hypothetical protein
MLKLFHSLQVGHFHTGISDLFPHLEQVKDSPIFPSLKESSSKAVLASSACPVS